MELLTPRWTTLSYHREQQRLWASKARFCVVPAGRRSGKTELLKRKIIQSALMFHKFPDGRFVLAAPTYAQAKRIFWDDVKAMVPKRFITGKPVESELTLNLYNGARIIVAGADKPERLEGFPIDGIGLDEYANMKESVWTKHLRAALSTINRPGWAWFTGVPEGRNHYYDLFCKADADRTGTWEAFTWKSAEILAPEEVEAARLDLDELTFRQEYEASFLTFSGRAYYCFDREIHAARELVYKPERDLIFCFDFNISPGVAAVIQEQDDCTWVIGEVHIPLHSNTPAVCRRLIKDWSHHKGDVLCYGDATGGTGGTAKVGGSDWDLIKEILRPVFKDRLKFRVPDGNPRERIRVNSINSRFRSANGAMRMFVCRRNAPMTVKDFEGVEVLEGGSGEIDKKKNPKVSHLSDAIGYYVARCFPINNELMTTEVVF